MTTNDANETTDADDTVAADTSDELDAGAVPPIGPRRSRVRAGLARARAHGRILRAMALLAVAAVIGAAYVVGGPSVGGASAAGDHTFSTDQGSSVQRQAAAATSGPVDTKANIGLGQAANPVAGGITQPLTPADGQSSLLAAESSQIVKTGQIDLEVATLDTAVGQAKAAIGGLGGSVDSSNQAGTGDGATASITFKVPVARWDEALADLHKIGSKVLSEQTNTTDVTSQVIDLDARLDNLSKTEAALQSIMSRATVIADVLAVESQLSDTQSQIEQLTAQRDNLKNQAAMSTLTATFQLPGQTVTTLATQDWSLGSQIDQAGAALVRIGQGLATIAVWTVVVLVPLGLAFLILFVIALLLRRIAGRGRNAVAGT